MMKYLLTALLACIAGNEAESQQAIHHYVWFGADRENIHTDTLFLNTKEIEGAQILYPWRRLEQGKDNYVFTQVREDIEFLRSKGKKLWIQLQDVSFSDRWNFVPAYIVNDSATYHGGSARQYEFKGENDSVPMTQGWVARRWDPAVQERFHKFLAALGKEFDGEIEGINLPETSVTFGTTGKYWPEGFTHASYKAGVIANMKALKKAFPKSVAMLYANFMPGEWRPTNDKGYLVEVYDSAIANNIAMGGPDIMPHRPGQMGTSLPLIRKASDMVPTGLAVQDGNLEEMNPTTKKPVTPEELIDFARNYLKLDYMFWGQQEPFYTRDVIPLLRRQGQATRR